MLRLCIGLRDMLLVSLLNLATLPLAAVLSQPTSRGTASDLYSRSGILSLWLLCVNNTLLDIACETEEGLLHVDVALGRNLHEWDSKLVRKCLTLLGGNGALLFPIALVAYEDLVHTFSCVLLDIREPSSDVYSPVC